MLCFNCGIFHTTRSCLFTDIEWGFDFYSFDVSVYVIVMSNLITGLNLAFLEMIDLTVGL